MMHRISVLGNQEKWGDNLVLAHVNVYGLCPGRGGISAHLQFRAFDPVAALLWDERGG